nr:MAG TPA: hypothetical protein [Bacteriophage sp.]DAO34031.1 MAG TPA: hypothetical protein [Bacteriophage sp.]
MIQDSMYYVVGYSQLVKVCLIDVILHLKE